MLFDTPNHVVVLSHEVVTGTDVPSVQAWVGDDPGRMSIFIEAYQPRHNLSPDKRMVTAVADLRRGLVGSKVLSNTGVKRVVPPQLMTLLGVWNWPQSTHHQDLRSAARIALLGMMKDGQLNTVLSAVVRDHLAGRTWAVESV
jgi:hypothetical protein